jgi:hypothetical protein
MNRRLFSIRKQNDLPLTWMDKYIIASIPFGLVGAGYGIREALIETKNEDIYSSTFTGSAYGVFGLMIGCTVWCFSPVLLTVGALSYLHKKL